MVGFPWVSMYIYIIRSKSQDVILTFFLFSSQALVYSTYFDDFPMQDVISFSSGISACEKCSNWTQALHLLRDLKAVYYPKNLKIVGVGG